MNINSTKESIRVTENDNVAKIEILNNCSLMVFFNEMKDKLSLEKFYHININNIFSGTGVFKKTIYVITNENKAYNLILGNTDNKNKISVITEKTIDKNEEDEVTINLLPNNNYSIKETKKDNNGVTKDIKLYEKRLTRDIPNFYKLSKNYALFIANDVLNNLKDIIYKSAMIMGYFSKENFEYLSITISYIENGEEKKEIIKINNADSKNTKFEQIV